MTENPFEHQYEEDETVQDEESSQGVYHFTRFIGRELRDQLMNPNVRSFLKDFGGKAFVYPKGSSGYRDHMDQAGLLPQEGGDGFVAVIDFPYYIVKEEDSTAWDEFLSDVATFAKKK